VVRCEANSGPVWTLCSHAGASLVLDALAEATWMVRPLEFLALDLLCSCVAFPSDGASICDVASPNTTVRHLDCIA
jgi:hypothetical protein